LLGNSDSEFYQQQAAEMEEIIIGAGMTSDKYITAMTWLAGRLTGGLSAGTIASAPGWKTSPFSLTADPLMAMYSWCELP
jgi:hypothetical protein